MISNYFKIEELVHPKTLERLGEDKCWALFDVRLIETIDFVRMLIGKNLIINNWNKGGQWKNRGYRELDCPVGAKNSKHKKGMAVDFSCSSYSAEDMRKHIYDNRDSLPYNIRLERDVNWVHIDVDNNTNAKVIYFNG